MFGSPVTRGLFANRRSARASGTSIGSPGVCIAIAQNEESRSVSVTARPTEPAKNCRCASTRLTAAIGVPQIHAVSAATACSAGVCSASISWVSASTSAAPASFTLQGSDANGRA